MPETIELLNNKFHWLSPSGGFVSPSGGSASLMFDDQAVPKNPQGHLVDPSAFCNDQIMPGFVIYYLNRVTIRLTEMIGFLSRLIWPHLATVDSSSWLIQLPLGKCKTKEWIQTTDKRTDVWSRNFMTWKINFGLLAVAWAGQWEKGVWADSEQLFWVVFSIFHGQKKKIWIFFTL